MEKEEQSAVVLVDRHWGLVLCRLHFLYHISKVHGGSSYIHSKTATTSWTIRNASRESQQTVRRVPIVSRLSVTLSLPGFCSKAAAYQKSAITLKTLKPNTDQVSAIRFTGMSDSCARDCDGEEAALDRRLGWEGKEEKEKGKDKWTKKKWTRCEDKKRTTGRRQERVIGCAGEQKQKRGEEVRETEMRHVQRYRMFEAACLTIKHKLYDAAEPWHWRVARGGGEEMKGPCVTSCQWRELTWGIMQSVHLTICTAVQIYHCLQYVLYVLQLCVASSLVIHHSQIYVQSRCMHREKHIYVSYEFEVKY